MKFPKLPEGFDLKINLKQAIVNAVSAVFVLKLAFSIEDPILLGLGGVFGFFGGSINDIVGWRRNKEAIQTKSGGD